MQNPKLSDFLDKCNARLYWRVWGEGDRFKIEGYMINGRIVVLQTFIEDDIKTVEGFQFFVTACEKNDLAAEFEAVEKAVGLK